MNDVGGLLAIGDPIFISKQDDFTPMQTSSFPPSIEMWAGDFNFEVEFCQAKIKKAIPSIVNKKLLQC